jgi:hypothetical protein
VYRPDNKRVSLAVPLAQFLIIQKQLATDGGQDRTVPATAAGKCLSIFDGTAEANMGNVTRKQSPLNAVALCAS